MKQWVPYLVAGLVTTTLASGATFLYVKRPFQVQNQSVVTESTSFFDPYFNPQIEGFTEGINKEFVSKKLEDNKVSLLDNRQLELLKKVLENEQKEFNEIQNLGLSNTSERACKSLYDYLQINLTQLEADLFEQNELIEQMVNKKKKLLEETKKRIEKLTLFEKYISGEEIKINSEEKLSVEELYELEKQYKESMDNLLSDQKPFLELLDSIENLQILVGEIIDKYCKESLEKTEEDQEKEIQKAGSNDNQALLIDPVVTSEIEGDKEQEHPKETENNTDKPQQIPRVDPKKTSENTGKSANSSALAEVNLSPVTNLPKQPQIDLNLPDTWNCDLLRIFFARKGAYEYLDAALVNLFELERNLKARTDSADPDSGVDNPSWRFVEGNNPDLNIFGKLAGLPSASLLEVITNPKKIAERFEGKPYTEESLKKEIKLLQQLYDDVKKVRDLLKQKLKDCSPPEGEEENDEEKIIENKTQNTLGFGNLPPLASYNKESYVNGESSGSVLEKEEDVQILVGEKNSVLDVNTQEEKKVDISSTSNDDSGNQNSSQNLNAILHPDPDPTLKTSEVLNPELDNNLKNENLDKSADKENIYLAPLDVQNTTVSNANIDLDISKIADAECSHLSYIESLYGYQNIIKKNIETLLLEFSRLEDSSQDAFTQPVLLNFKPVGIYTVDESTLSMSTLSKYSQPNQLAAFITREEINNYEEHPDNVTVQNKINELKNDLNLLNSFIYDTQQKINQCKNNSVSAEPQENQASQPTQTSKNQTNSITPPSTSGLSSCGISAQYICDEQSPAQYAFTSLDSSVAFLGRGFVNSLQQGFSNDAFCIDEVSSSFQVLVFYQEASLIPFPDREFIITDSGSGSTVFYTGKEVSRSANSVTYQLTATAKVTELSSGESLAFALPVSSSVSFYGGLQLQQGASLCR